MADGTIGATVMQFPTRMGQMAVESVIKAVNDGVRPSGFNNTGTVLITDHPVAGIEFKDFQMGTRKLLGRVRMEGPELTGPAPGQQSANPAAAAGAAAALRLRALGLFAYPITGPLFALIVIFVVFSLGTSTFMNAGNISLIVQQSVVIGTLALGQTLIILVSGIDLANGAIMVLGTVVAGSYASHGDALTALLLGFVVCVIVASISGLVITRFRLPPFIATLGMFTIVAAGARLYTQSRSFPITSDFLAVLGSGPDFGAVTVTFGSMLWVLLTLVLGYALTETAWGVRVYAIGNSPSAARLNGVNVTRVIFSVYALAGSLLRLRGLAGVRTYANRRSERLPTRQSR